MWICVFGYVYTQVHVHAELDNRYVREVKERREGGIRKLLEERKQGRGVCISS